MNEIENALVAAEHAQYHTFIADGGFYYADGVKELVITALREKLEREKGCEYCKESKNIYQVKSELHDSMNEDVYVSGDALVVDIGCHSYGTAEIRFCPMCGRPLKTAMPGEEKQHG